jgi:hypothetical protein
MKYTIPNKRVWWSARPMKTFGPHPSDTHGTVYSNFVGLDGEERVIVQTKNGCHYDYICVHWHSLQDSKDGKSNFDRLMENPAYKSAYTLKIGIAAGIWDKNGDLTKTYR